MEYEIRIASCANINEDIVTSIKREYIDAMVNDLGITTLKEICFTDDLPTEVNIINEKYNQPKEDIINNKYFSILGKTCRISDSPHFIVVCQIEVLGCIINKAEMAQRARNIIHHELGHVSDDTKRCNFKKKVEAIEDNNTVRSSGLSKANYLFSEYMANRLSSSSIDKISSLNIQTAFNYYTDMKEVVNTAMKMYREDKTSINLFRTISNACSLILVECCYIIGNLHGIGNPESTRQLIYNKWEGTPFQSIWSDLERELNNLYSLYGDWSDFSVLDSLAQLYIRSLNVFGIELKDTEKGMAMRII